MSRFYFIAVLLLSSLQAIADNFYGQTIYAQDLDQKEYKESLNDLSIYLSKITGKNFSVRNGEVISGKGIFVFLNRKGILDESSNNRLQNGNSEGFVLSGNSERLLIVASHPSGLSKGIYTYLDWLGVKWYFPGERWEKLVSKTSINYPFTTYSVPSFIYRNFFGTGGIRSVTPIDPSGKIMKEWEDWKRRNRMGSEFDIGGHYGEVFNVGNQNLLEQNPQYLALVNGKRVWNVSAKWCVSNAGFRKAFIEDRVSELRKSLNLKTYPYNQVVLSVDPSDGGGDCECDNCKKLGTVSDRYYFLANEVAKAFKKISPRASVSLMAYNTHAAPPSFALMPNVVVMIVPYAFQNFGTPQQFIEAWTRRHTNLLMYDYYCMPDWHYDVPSPRKTSWDILVNRIRYWKQKKIKGFLLESAYGTGLAGPGLYLAARLGWDNQAKVEEIRKEFYNDMFGTAAGEMGRYFQFLNTDYVDESSLAYLRFLLTSAKNKVSGEQSKRITDIQAYVHYLSLYYQWQSAKEKVKAWEELVQYAWQIYPTGIIHSTRIADLFFYQLKENDPLIKDWNIVEPFGKKLKNIHTINEKQVEDLTAQDMKKSPLLEGFTYTKTKATTYSLKPEKKINSAEERMILGVNFPGTFVKASAAGRINFSIRMNDESAPPSPVLITLIDTTSTQIAYSKSFEIDHRVKDISIAVSKAKTYQLKLEYRPWLWLKFPIDQWAAFKEIPTYSVMNTLWFYVPPTINFVYFSNSEIEQPVFKNSESKIIQPEKVNEHYMYRLKNNSKGEWWSISSSQYKFLQFYSVPDLFFPHIGYTVSGK